MAHASKKGLAKNVINVHDIVTNMYKIQCNLKVTHTLVGLVCLVYFVSPDYLL